MLRLIDRRAHLGERDEHPGRGLVVHHAHRLDHMPGVRGQRGLHAGDINAMAPVGGNRPDLDLQRAGHLRPFVGEITGLQQQDRVARRQQVGQRRLPRAVPRAGIHEQTVLGTQHALHPLEARVIDLAEVRVVEVDRRPVNRAEHAVGDVGRAGVGEEMPAAGLRDGSAHVLDLMMAAASIRETVDL